MPLPVQQPNLGQILGPYSIAPAASAGMQEMQANENNSLNQAGFLQDLIQSQEKHPLDMQGKSLQNQGLEAGLPGIFANSQLLGQRAKRGAATLDSDIDTDLSNNYTKMDANSASQLASFADMLGQLGAAAEQGIALPMLNSLPAELRKVVSQPGGGTKLREISKQMLESTNKFQMQDAKGEGALEKLMLQEQLRSRRELAVAEVRRSAANEVAAARAKAVQAKDPKTLEAVAAKLAAQALSETDPTLKAELQAQANEALSIAQQFNVNVRGGSQVGGIDAGAVADLPTRQPPAAPVLGNNPAVTPSTGSAAQTRPQSLGDLQKLYPGVPADKLKEAYKKKFGIDIQ